MVKVHVVNVTRYKYKIHNKCNEVLQQSTNN